MDLYRRIPRRPKKAASYCRPAAQTVERPKMRVALRLIGFSAAVVGNGQCEENVAPA